MRAILLLTGAALVGAACWWGASVPADPAPADAAGGPVPAGGAAGRMAPGAVGNGPSAQVSLSDASGLTLDAARLFELGFGGGLLLDRDTRASIEALINTMPLEPSAQDMDRLQRVLRAGLPYEEAEKAYKLISNYRSYSRDVQREMLPMGIPKNQDEARQLYDRMDAMKRRYFDESTANALFGADERYARLTMEAGFIHQDATLSAEQKAQAIEALRARLPAERRELIPPYVAPEPPEPSDAAASLPSSS
ncbi:MAG: hypothetical protein KF891_17815 [Rhizobacter sp.]|nr:hypothetical protein [Rhizobacter sp.]